MKKKIILSSAAVILCIALITCSVTFAKSGYSSLSGPENAENIAASQLESAVSENNGSDAFKAVDADTHTAWRSPEKKDSIILTFSKAQSFNTAVIREKGWNIKAASRTSAGHGPLLCIHRSHRIKAEKYKKRYR